MEMISSKSKLIIKTNKKLNNLINNKRFKEIKHLNRD
jgi:hypothetical protein